MINTFMGKYRFLSNFFSAEVEYGGLCYPTVEHAFQAAKSLYPYERLKVQAATSPGAAKHMGRVVTLRPDWESIKYQVMFNLVSKKFTNHPHLRDQLLMTGDVPLIEGNTWGDTTWGMCKGIGNNWLGKILMEVRISLKKGENKMLTVYTARDNYKGPNRVDITVKNAVPPWKVFAPTWDMVMEYLRGTKDAVAERVYKEKYDAIVLKAFMYNNKALTTLIHSNETRVLVCFCKAGSFCHRTLLAVHLASLGANYLGEINRWGSGKYEFV